MRLLSRGLSAASIWQASASHGLGKAVPSLRRWSRFGGNVVMNALQRAAHEPTSEPKTPESALSSSVRQAMRRVPHPVFLIHAESEEQGKSSLLVSSFNTVTLHPRPLVSFNIKLPSRTYEAIKSSESFTASALYSVHAARHYSQYWQKRAPWRTQKPIADEYDGYLLRSRVWGMRCRWLQEKSVEVGDHMIMVGEVVEYETPLAMREDKNALVYMDGQYRDASKPALLKAHQDEQALAREEQLKKALGPSHGAKTIKKA